MIQGMFLLSRLWEKILFDYDASHSFVAASSVDVLGLEVETLDELLHMSSPLGTRVRIRAGNLSLARWARPTNPKLGLGWALIFLAQKNRAKFSQARLARWAKQYPIELAWFF